MAEIKDTLQSAWTTFQNTDRNSPHDRIAYALHYRLRLFNMVITPTFYGTRKNDQIGTEKNATAHCSNEEEVQNEDKQGNESG